MNRRNLIKTLAFAGGFPAFFGVSNSLLAQSSYTGKFLIVIQLDGGVDVTSFCDPKANVAGEEEINRWARSADIQQVGNLSYAPYAENAVFFEKYYKDMLVINGVDAQTNAHTVGVINNWSGRSADGYPTVTALTAAVRAPELPLAYLNFGGFGATAGTVRSTRIDNVAQIRNIIFPNLPEDPGEGLTFRNHSDWQRIQALQIKNLTTLSQDPNVLEGSRKNRQYYLDAFSRAEGIKVFGDQIPDSSSIQQQRAITESVNSTLHQQAQVTLLAFKSGVAIAADLFERGYDTHSHHDRDHTPLMANTTDAIDYLWTTAEEMGIADRLVVVVGSDFGRTPHFNASDGKDHWPIGSYMVMEKNVAYTNQMIGETDGGHNAFRINSDSLVRDDSNGTIIYPKHIHKALRRYLGIEDSPITKIFPFNNTEDFNFFG